MPYATKSSGDPDFVDVPTDQLLSEQFAAAFRGSIDLERATPSDRVLGRVGGADEGKHTTHVSIVDGNGNAVALTTTLNNDFGSAVTVTGAGFLLNNEMDDFTAEPGAPNGFGLVQGEANAIVPGKRMLSSMAPTIVVGRDGVPLLVAGAGGGSRIISAVFQVTSNWYSTTGWTWPRRSQRLGCTTSICRMRSHWNVGDSRSTCAARSNSVVTRFSSLMASPT